MISKTRPAFWRAYGLLASSVKARAREVYRLSGDTIEWIWIGTHNEFDKLFT